VLSWIAHIPPPINLTRNQTVSAFPNRAYFNTTLFIISVGDGLLRARIFATLTLGQPLLATQTVSAFSDRTRIDTIGLICRLVGEYFESVHTI
jgi:hypothetical protein